MTSPARPQSQLVVLSGCSGGGKSTLLAELSRRGFTTVPEPGLRIVTEELARAGTALPWHNLEAFLERALSMALDDHARAAQQSGRVFFDRGIVDAAVGLNHLTGMPRPDELPRYYNKVFLVPPWAEIYVQDDNRQHGMAEAVAEYERLLIAYPSLGYTITEVPRLPVEQRADFVLDSLAVA